MVRLYAMSEKNSKYKFPQPKMKLFKCLLCPNNDSKLKDIQFTIM